MNEFYPFFINRIPNFKSLYLGIRLYAVIVCHLYLRETNSD